MGERELKGKNRFVVDGLATRNECQKIMEVAKFFAVQGDGYYGNKSPHTTMEKFEGITLSRITVLVYFGLLDPKYLDLYLKLTERVKKHLENLFKVKQQLYFTYTHLVCRTALSNSPINRSDFSHAIHADNCNVLDDGVCTRESPAYTWRDYSAILYLNADFDGGEFVFSQDMEGRNLQSTIKPVCGRVVGFSSGGENLHGVKAVTKGSRCAVGLWFTFDPEHTESARTVAYKML